MITSLPDPGRRAVITGLGVLAPTGIGTDAWWRETLAGTSGIRPIERFDAARYPIRFAGQVEGFDPHDHLDRRLMVQTDRWTWMGLAGARLALDDAGLDPAVVDPSAVSVITASSTGGNEFAQGEIERLWSRGPRHVGAFMSIAWFYAATSGQISIRHGLKGHSSAIAAEGAGGLAAAALARRTIRRGVEAVVSGGMEAPVGNPMAIACQMSNPALAADGDATAYRPFDRHAAGAVPGEGGAIVMIESRAHARARHAEAYAEIAGYGATSDAVDPRRPATDGRQYARAISIALDDAGVAPADVDAVFADGAGTLSGDSLELTALRTVLGDHASAVPVTVPKSMTGRLYAGGASLDLAAAAMAIRHQTLPPTINVEAPVPRVDLVREARRGRADTVLVLARGHGGFNAALVLTRPQEC